MRTSTGLITYEASLAMPENKLEEIIQGESRIMPPPSRGHASLVETLAELLETQLDKKQFRVKTAPYGLGITREPVLHYRLPDLSVFATRKLAQETDPYYIWFAPELVVECLSPSNRKGNIDELVADYASIGTPEAWLLFPEETVLAVYQLGDRARLREVQRLTSGTISPLRFPKAHVDLDELWTAFATRL